MCDRGCGCLNTCDVQVNSSGNFMDIYKMYLAGGHFIRNKFFFSLSLSIYYV